MKTRKTVSLALVLVLLLALLSVGAAADPTADAMRVYADVVANAAGYDFGLDPAVEYTDKNYFYTIVDLIDGNGVPTLLLQLEAFSFYGGFDYIRMFQYDAASGTVLAPAARMMGGVASAGGYRGGTGICAGRLATAEWGGMSGDGWITEYRLVGGELQPKTLWSGKIYENPYKMEPIDWVETWDTAAFDAYLTPPGPAVVLSPQNLTVDGRAVACEKYNIDGSNYFKLRDIAQLLSGTPAQFGVSWDPEANAIVIAPGFAYEPVGGELAVGEDKSGSAVASAQTVWFLDAPVTDLSVYNIGGNNFFKLRELGSLIGFEVDYDSATDTAIVRTGAADAPTPVPGDSTALTALRNAVMQYGTAERKTAADGTAYTLYRFTMVEDGAEPLSVCCEDPSGRIYLLYKESDSSVYAFLELDLSGTDGWSEACLRVESDDEDVGIDAAARVDRKTVMQQETVSFYRCELVGIDDGEEAARVLGETVCGLIQDILTYSDTLFQEYGIPVTVADFGFVL